MATEGIVIGVDSKTAKFHWAQTTADEGVTCDLMSTFDQHRCIALGSKHAEAIAQLRNPLCGQKTSTFKSTATQKEVQKLVNRYSESLEKVGGRGFLSEVKSQPAWQKLPQWIESQKATACYECSSRFRSFSTKVNCHIGGQVFCTDCTTDRMVIYDTPEGAKWAINGKDGGPSAVPSSYCLLSVCSNCSCELQAFLSRKYAASSTDFLERLHCLHKTISKLQLKIESILPKYLIIVDSLSMDDGSPNYISEKNPIQYVAKAHCDLVYIFDMLSTNFQKLKSLNPQSATEEKLQSTVVQCTNNFVKHMNTKFQVAKNCLRETMPLQDLQKVQKTVNEQNLEQVYSNLKRLNFELSCFAQIYNFNDDVLKTLQTTLSCFEEEYCMLELENKTEWLSMEENPRLVTLDPQVTNLKNIQYVLVSQISSCLGEYLQQLLNKTTEQDFLRAKESLQNASLILDRLQLSSSSS